MKPFDARVLSDEAINNLRKRGVALYKAKISMKTISETLHVSYSVVRKWVRLYKTGKYKALITKKRGRIRGKKELNEDIESRVKAGITNSLPDHLGLEFNLWSRKAIQRYMQRHFEIRKSLMQIGRYLKDWGITESQPAYRIKESLNPRIKNWIEREYPKIVKMATKENAEICWLTNRDIKLHVKGKNENTNASIENENRYRRRSPILNMFAAINNRGKKKFMILKNEPNEIHFILFLKRLSLENKKPLFIITESKQLSDGLQVRRWINKNNELGRSTILMFYMPSANLMPIEKKKRVKFRNLSLEKESNHFLNY